MSEQTASSDLADESLSPARIEEARAELGERVLTTPVLEWRDGVGELDPSTRIFMKLELLQRAGSFKVRAAFLNMMRLPAVQLSAGVAAASAGNHAIAVAYAAHLLGVSAKLVMFATPNPLRLDLCQRYGAEVIIARSPHEAFELVEMIAREEGRAIIPPYEGLGVALGTATIGLELCRQTDPLDAVIVPVGGGGLAAGVAAAVKAYWPDCDVYGVEPLGACSMFDSLRLGAPQALARVHTIADSLGAPRAMPISFDLCRRRLSSVELVSDGELRAAMRLMLEASKLAVEPAGAAPLAGLLGPLRERLSGRRVGLIVSGSNIDAVTFSRLALAGGPDQRTPLMHAYARAGCLVEPNVVHAD